MMAEGISSDELQRLDWKISRLLSRPRPIWSDSADSKSFLEAVDNLLALLAGRGGPRAGIVGHADVVLYKSMQRLTREFEVLMEHGITPSASSPFPPSSGPLQDFGPHSDDDEEEDEEAGTRFSAPKSDERIPVAKPVTDYNVIIDALPWGTISDLRDIAKRMLAAGSTEDCIRAYCAARRRFLQESVSRLGLWKFRAAGEEKEAAEDQSPPASSEWAEIEAEVHLWVAALKVAVLVLYPSERRLCQRVFQGMPGPSDIVNVTCANSCLASALRLLSFADTVCQAAGGGGVPPLRLYRFLNMYQTIRDLLPEIQAVFPAPYGAPVKEKARRALGILAEAIRDVFREFYNLVLRDKVDGPSFPADAGVHPINRYVVNFLHSALKSWRTLLVAMEEEGGVDLASTGNLEVDSVDDNNPRLELEVDPSSSNLYGQVSWIMEQLQSNLEARAKLYGDHTPRLVFQINNAVYIIRKASGSELGQLLGEDWIRWRVDKVHELQARYLSKTWGKAQSLLRPQEDGQGGRKPKSAADDEAGSSLSGEQRILTFCAHLDELCARHRKWAIVDERLRAELWKSVADSVVPAYRELLASVRRDCNSTTTSRKMQISNIWYSKEYVNDLINGTFGF